VADHVRLRRDVSLAAQGLPIKSKPALGFGGSYNYGLSRISAAMEHGYLTGDKKLAEDARKMWLENEEEQLKIGHHCHREQCEQLEPEPHSAMVEEAVCLVWRGALRRSDAELAAACEANMGRSVALWKRLNLGGIVCSPSARAKDPEDKSNDAGVGQWRNRPADAILGRVVGGKWIKYDGLSVQLFDACVMWKEKDRENLLERLRFAPVPKLRVPVHLAEVSGGYIAWHEPTAENRKALGKDALSGVIHTIKGKPELFYDWGAMPALPEGSKPVLLGS
jgi:hypothetical protein